MVNEQVAAERIEESVHDFHHRPLPTLDPDSPTPRRMWVPALSTRQTVVLGSRQRPELLDADALGRADVDVVRRRSGGGAVMVSAADLVWCDVLIGADDPAWHDDVTRSFHWIGDRIAAALATLGTPAAVHPGPLQKNRWSELVCFAGLGPGELTVDDAKVVGISQRRTRTMARFQIAILRRWAPGELLDLLDLSADERRDAHADIADAAIGLPHTPESMLSAIERALGTQR